MTGKDVANFFGAGGVPAVKDIGSALKQKSVEAAPMDASDTPFLRLLTKGYWVYGQDNVDVEEDSLWAINPLSVATGYIAWKDSKPVGEHMATLGEPPVNVADLPQDLGENTRGNRKGQKVTWDQQIAFVLRCISGEDEGQQVLYKTTTHGGRREATRVIDEIAARAANGDTDIVPVVELAVDSYDHKDYGETFTPDFAIAKWVNLEGDAAADDGEADDENEDSGDDTPKSETKEPAKRQRRAAKAAETADDTTESDDGEQPSGAATDAPRRRRRRRG